MMALPRSATKALGRWPWKHHDVLDTREGTDREGLKAGFAPEDKAESQPIEHEATPIVRTPSKLVKKRDAKPKDGETDEKGEAERPATPSPNSETAEHVIVPFEPVPRPPTPKPNVLVKKNSLSKRAAAKAAEPQDVPLPDGPDAVPEPLSTVASDSKEEKAADIPETPQHTVDPPGPIERETPAVPDTPAAPSHDHGLSSPSSSHVHPFPVRGVTPPNGTRFIEGTDGSLEPTESRTTGTTNHRPPRPPKPQRRISLRSFGFFYGKDHQLTGAFPVYVPPSERIVYEVRDEDEPVHRPAPTHKRTNSRLPIGLLSPRKPASPKVTKSDKRAVASALSLRTLIIGPAAMEPKNKAKKVDPKASAASALRKVNQQLLMPTEANRVIAALRDLPPPDLPPAAAQTVETVRKKKGWVFGRGGTRDEGDRQEALKGSTGTVAMPIHGCCLDITDEEAEEKHFSKLTGSGFAAPGSAVGTEPVANTASADLSSLVPMLKDLRLVNLQASPDLSSVNVASLNAQLNAPDLGFGQSADRDGPLAGSVPSAGSLVDGMEKVGQTLMSLGFATTAAVLPSHVGIHPPKDRMSVLTYWWGYEVVLPPPTMRYLGHVKSISGALLNFLTAFSLFSNGVREMLPFIRYIAQFIEFEWNAIKAQDKGRGVVCAATWVMPAALVPRPWDFVDPPMNDRMARTVTPGPASMHPATLAGLVPQASAADLTGPATEPGETSVDDAFNAEVRDEAPMVPLVRHIEEDEQRQIETDNATTEIKDATTPVLKRSEDRDTQDT